MYHSPASGVSSAWRRDMVLSVLGRASLERPMSWGRLEGSSNLRPLSGPWMTVRISTRNDTDGRGMGCVVPLSSGMARAPSQPIANAARVLILHGTDRFQMDGHLSALRGALAQEHGAGGVDTVRFDGAQGQRIL